MEIMQQFSTPEGVHIMLMPLAEKAEQMLSQLPTAAEYAVQLSQLKSEQRRLEFVGVRLLLFKAFGAQKKIVYNEARKPFLNDKSYSISISHTNGYACISWHETLLSGIDIERIGKRMERVQRRFLSATELATLQDDERHTKAHLYWSAKESVYKIIGDKVVDFQKSIEIEPFEQNERGTFYAVVLPEKQKITIHYWCTSNYVLTTAVVNAK